MDQSKIGQFIAERRRLLGLTQLQLAERLHVTDRAVSKWERGKAMPDSSLILTLCGVLKINVNDLFYGEVLTMEDYSVKNEELVIELARQKQEADRRILRYEVLLGVFSALVLLIPTVIALCMPVEEWQKVVIVLSGLIPALVGFLFALRMEQTAGYYRCGRCGHAYIPKYVSTLFAPHLGRTRYMRCPECGKRGWQKKSISKD